jgi:futalosine hydrolase
MPGPDRLLIATAVDAERDAIRNAIGAAPGVRVITVGVGPASAAAMTATALATSRPDLVISAGICGGLNGCRPGEVLVADRILFADLGAETDGGFVPMSALGFGTESYPVDATLASMLAARSGGRLGTILTVATATGTAATAVELTARHPDAVGEAMEGAGVAAAASLADVAFAEVRAVSNVVGPRDRDSWQIAEALTALGQAFAAICADPSVLASRSSR